MVDAHVHLEKGSYCIEWIQEFIQYALSRNINEVYFLEHTHIFKECSRVCLKNKSCTKYVFFFPFSC